MSSVKQEKSFLKRPFYSISLLILLVAFSLSILIRFYCVENVNYRETITFNDINNNYHFSFFRKEDGIIELFADNTYNFSFAMGYTHAYDRLLSMTLTRIVSQGRISELLVQNEVTERMDIWIRSLGFPMIVKKNLEEIENKYPSDILLYQSYVDGINYYQKNLNVKPFEAYIASLPMDPWTITDCFKMMLLMTIDSGLGQSQYRLEKFLIKSLSDGIDIKLLQNIFPQIKDISKKQKDLILKTHFYSSSTDFDNIQNIHYSTNLHGSNNWVISPKLSESKKVLYAADPHMNINRLPSIWYESIGHISSNNIDIYGITFPGLPIFVMGRTNYLSWSFTYGFADQIDLYLIEIKDHKYLVDGKWLPLDIRSDTLFLKNGSSIPLKFYHTPHGIVEIDPTQPLVDGLYYIRCWVIGYGSIANKGIRFFEQAFKGKTVKEIMPIDILLSANLIVADHEGNIFLQQTGHFPERPTHHDGLIPIEYSNSSNHWYGILPQKDLYQNLNPKEGYLISANNWITSKAVTVSMMESRKKRINKMIEDIKKTRLLTLQDMKDIQLDVYSLECEQLLPYFQQFVSPSYPPFFRDSLLEFDCRFVSKSFSVDLYLELKKVLLKKVFGERIFGKEGWNLIQQDPNLKIYHWWVMESFFKDLKKPNMYFKTNIDRDNLIKSTLQTVFQNITELPHYYNYITMYNIFFRDSLPHFFGYDYSSDIDGYYDTPCKLSNYIQPGATFANNVAPSWRLVTELPSKSFEKMFAGGVSDRRFSGLYTKGLEDYFDQKYTTIDLHQ